MSISSWKESIDIFSQMTGRSYIVVDCGDLDHTSDALRGNGNVDQIISQG